MEKIFKLKFVTFEDETEFRDTESGEVVDPVETLIEYFNDMPRDYVNFDVYKVGEEDL